MAETICAIATPPGQGGLGIVRVSGPLCREIAKQVTGTSLMPRRATLSDFKDHCGEIIDQGIVLLYESPASYTGEDVLEFQGHGSPVALGRLIECILSTGARLAHPGEFTQRAFLNNKLDLTQAEAVADFISSQSKEASIAALRSLRGEFASQVRAIDAKLLKLRVYIEGALDFAEEEIDFLTDDAQIQSIDELLHQIEELLARTTSGQLLQQGINVVIAGPPNVGKSSLLNRLLGEDRAIVTEIAGTTRDTLEGTILLEGIPVRITDTAGIHVTPEAIEKEGIRRAHQAIEEADLVLWLSVDGERTDHRLVTSTKPSLQLWNKCDLTGEVPGKVDADHFRISALKNQGLEDLLEGVKSKLGLVTRPDIFAGRPRHINALKGVKAALTQTRKELLESQGDLVAENLGIAHRLLGEIVGATSQDELLGEIFATFCIGK